MENLDNFRINPEIFKDEQFEKALAEFQVDSWVFIERSGQFGMVEEVRPSAEGPRIKVKHIGSVPIADIRLATEEEVADYLKSRE